MITTVIGRIDNYDYRRCLRFTLCNGAHGNISLSFMLQIIIFNSQLSICLICPLRGMVAAMGGAGVLQLFIIILYVERVCVLVFLQPLFCLSSAGCPLSSREPLHRGVLTLLLRLFCIPVCHPADIRVRCIWHRVWRISPPWPCLSSVWRGWRVSALSLWPNRPAIFCGGPSSRRDLLLLAYQYLFLLFVLMCLLSFASQIVSSCSSRICRPRANTSPIIMAAMPMPSSSMFSLTPLNQSTI